MSAGNFAPSLKEVLLHEGGFVNHPKDPGGMTNLGVTKQTYEDWIGHPVSEAIMRKLTPELVGPLYKKKYWDVLRCEALPKGLDLCVFDFGVNAGTNRSGRYLQRLVGAQQDGVVGPVTVKAVEALRSQVGTPELIDRFQDARRAYYKQLPTFPTFGRGWLRRVDEVEKTAKTMATGRSK